MGIAILMLVVAGGFALWGAIAPEHSWRVLQSWQYKRPEAHEPSEAAFAVTRVVSVIALVVVIVMIPVLLGIQSSGQQQQDQQRYRDCLAQNQDTDGLLTAEDWCKRLSPSPSP